MKPVIVIGLNNLRITEHLGNGDAILDDARIVTHFSAIARHLPRDFDRFIGAIELDHLKTRTALIWWQGGEDQVIDDPLGFLDRYLAIAQALLTSLWLVQDNSANSDTGFLAASTGNQLGVHSNSRVIRFCCANGRDQELAISRETLRAARERARHEWDDPTAHSLSGGTALHRETSRYARAMYFVQGARAEHDLGLKIASYVQSLEALLCATSGELAHGLAERCAFFVPGPAEQRMEIYELVRKGYSIRSRIFHGDALSGERIRSLERVSVALDDISRRALLKAHEPEILRELLLPTDAFEDAMIRRIICMRP